MARYLVRVWFGDPDAGEPNSGQQSHMDLRVHGFEASDAIETALFRYADPHLNPYKPRGYCRRYGFAPIVGAKIIWAGCDGDAWGGPEAIPPTIKPHEPLPPPVSSDTPRRPRARKGTTASTTSSAHARGGKGRRRA